VKLYFLVAAANKSSPLNKIDCNDILTKSDLELKHSMLIAANAFCVTIVCHHEDQCFRVKPDCSVFPEPPKIHLLVSGEKQCILLNKIKKEESNYSFLRNLTRDIQKNKKRFESIQKEKGDKVEEQTNIKTLLKNIKIQKEKAEEDKKQFDKLREGSHNVLQKIGKILEDHFINTYYFILSYRKNNDRANELKKKLNKDSTDGSPEELKVEKSMKTGSKNLSKPPIKITPNQLLITETYLKILDYEGRLPKEAEKKENGELEEAKKNPEVKKPSKVKKDRCKICGRDDRKGHTLYEDMFLCDICIYIERWKKEKGMNYFQGLINDKAIKIEESRELKNMLPS